MKTIILLLNVILIFLILMRFIMGTGQQDDEHQVSYLDSNI